MSPLGVWFRDLVPAKATAYNSCKLHAHHTIQQPFKFLYGSVLIHYVSFYVGFSSDLSPDSRTEKITGKK